MRIKALTYFKRGKTQIKRKDSFMIKVVAIRQGSVLEQVFNCALEANLRIKELRNEGFRVWIDGKKG